MSTPHLRGDKSTLRFWHRTDKVNKDGSAPVHLVYQLHSNKRCYSIPDTVVFGANWNRDEQKFIYIDKKKADSLTPKVNFNLLLSKKDVDEKNAKLQQVVSDVKNIETRFRLDDEEFDCDKVVNALKGIRKPLTKRIDTGKSIVDFIERFTKESTAHRPGTIKAYRGVAEHLKRFETDKRQPVTFQNIDVPLMKGFQNFLLEKKRSHHKKG